MSIGLGIFLIALGAIVTWAVPALWTVEGVNWTMIGYILMGAGLVITLFSIIAAVNRSNRSQVTRTSVDPQTGERIERTRRRD